MSIERWVDCDRCYGNGCTSCGGKGRFETDEYREAREDHEERRADERRHNRIFGEG